LSNKQYSGLLVKVLRLLFFSVETTRPVSNMCALDFHPRLYFLLVAFSRSSAAELASFLRQ